MTTTPSATPAPPVTRRDDLVEDLHGRRVADPYRWLEGSGADEVADWVRAQNAVTSAHLDALAARASFRARLAELWDHPRRGVPWRRGATWFQRRNDGLQDQDVLWCVSGADVEEPPVEGWRVLLDPNTWSEDGTASLSALAASDDGALLAFARSDAGSDWLTWRVLDTADGTVHDDVVPWGKFSTAAWLPDGSGFLYGAFVPPGEGEEHAAANRDQQLRLHRLGTDPAADEIVHQRPDRPEWMFHPTVTHDGRWLVLTVTHGTRPETRIHVAAIDEGRVGPVHPLLDEGDAAYEVLGVLDDALLLTTDHQAPLGRVVTVSLDGRRGEATPATAPQVTEVVAEAAERLEGATLVGGDAAADPAWLVCRRLRHATARVAVHDARDGRHLGDLALPGAGTVGELAGGRRRTHVEFTFETFDAPARLFSADLASRHLTMLPAPVGTDVGAAADHVVTEQVQVLHDGVAVPLFLVHRADVTPAGTVPTMLWGYGGFDIPVTPMHRPGWRAWVEAGGLLAVACLRGGGEYGRSWHDDGRLGNKQHVFDDALACAAWLTGRRRAEVTAAALTADTDPNAVWSAPHHLGIEGRSNGGLLVGACLTQEPDAFGAAVPEVGVLDLTRFHRFTIGWAWISDYGDPDRPEDLEVLLRYSPYHRVEEGRAYPPTLITTGDTDDRVVPLHSYKFAAALQHAQGGDAPVLLRVDTSAGHGAGKPVGKLLDERADVLAFCAHHLGLRV
ncbi:prolyl oligopeptidase family serine peptidase [Egicoccus halophilus]|uniref:prolyl oligopeptidase n=1 Tax=Egicoccus halophilus TaxID=1670830 RepID=A0A8J3ESL3_9ACTN|nr:prolyl oligopeptidase family serine peptidase [Egicoccus halophilus]GGI03212.1 prolyl endopeptidase [Egicoccus halophilus]